MYILHISLFFKKLSTWIFRNIPTRNIRDVKRLYLSGQLINFSDIFPSPNRDLTHPKIGNPLPPQAFLSEPCYNLLYLELAGCRLTSLPRNFSSLVPNLRVLNLNYNFIEDDEVLVDALKGLGRLRKLTVVGGRVRGTKSLVKIVRGMADLEMVDFRCVNEIVTN